MGVAGLYYEKWGSVLKKGVIKIKEYFEESSHSEISIWSGKKCNKFGGISYADGSLKIKVCGGFCVNSKARKEIEEKLKEIKRIMLSNYES